MLVTGTWWKGVILTSKTMGTDVSNHVVGLGCHFFFQELVSTPVGHTQNSCFDMGKFPKDVFGLMASLYHHNLVQGHPGLRNWQV